LVPCVGRWLAVCFSLGDERSTTPAAPAASVASRTL
jgi:hypothetical protein